jgi:hypothetical protein
MIYPQPLINADPVIVFYKFAHLGKIIANTKLKTINNLNLNDCFTPKKEGDTASRWFITGRILSILSATLKFYLLKMLQKSLKKWAVKSTFEKLVIKFI